MTSHREAPAISKDPVADNTDLYAFVSPDKPDSVTLIANYIPLEMPAGGPNFFEFGEDVAYSIHIDNDADAIADIVYTFRFQKQVLNLNTFLYNLGPISSLTSSNWNVRQTYTVTRTDDRGSRVLGTNLPCPPVNIGPRSTPNYSNLANAAISSLSDGSRAFAGQRGEGFAVDLGSIFDLLALRPFENLHLIPTPAAPGVDSTVDFNMHSIALQVDKRLLSSNGSVPSDVMDPKSVIGIWATASRQEVSADNDDDRTQEAMPLRAGPWKQVSRLGNPLINEVVIPLSKKNYWNKQQPVKDSQFKQYYTNLEVASLMPVLYPVALKGVPNAPSNPRTDIEIVLGTGIPSGVIPGFQNYTGPTFADMLRLNMAVPPNTSNPNRLGLIAGDAAGFPNGRRPLDDTIDIYLQVAAGVIYPLVKSGFVPPAAAGLLSDGVNEPKAPFLGSFPYLPTPFSGYDYESGEADSQGP
ncbi:MAG: DUF4331 domain-containing protein [Nitrososphaerales archaeon]